MINKKSTKQTFGSVADVTLTDRTSSVHRKMLNDSYNYRSVTKFSRLKVS